MSKASDRGIWTSLFQTLVESNQWLILVASYWYLSLPSQVLGIIRIRQGLVGSVWDYCEWVGYQGMVLGGLVSQWGSTIQLPWVCTVTSRYLLWHDFRCCQDVKLQQPTSLSFLCPKGCMGIACLLFHVLTTSKVLSVWGMGIVFLDHLLWGFFGFHLELLILSHSNNQLYASGLIKLQLYLLPKKYVISEPLLCVDNNIIVICVIL